MSDDKKISQLDSVLPLDGDLVPVVQDGVTKRVAALSIAQLIGLGVRPAADPHQ